MRLYFSVHLLVLVLSLGATMQSFAGIQWVDIGVNGLTCSMCSRSVEMSLRRLDFVDSVSMSLEKTEGRIFLHNNTPVNLQQIAKAVVNAGFSVRFLRVEFSFNDVAVNQDGSFSYRGQDYEWIDFNGGITKARASLKLVDENFLPKKESLQWKKKVTALTKSGNQKNVLHVVQEG
jgi:copper chaperone CopZ